MYLGTRKLHNPQLTEFHRQELLKNKRGAICLLFNELEGLINKSELAKQYFHRSQGWLSQRIHGAMVAKKEKCFSEEEAQQLVEALRHIAMRLNAHADEIEAAPMESQDDAE